MIDWLRRDRAPLSERTWKAIDQAVIGSARQELAARRIADFEGPKGWQHVAEPLGTTSPRPDARSGAARALPDAMLLTEIRADFALPWTAIDAYERGARTLDTGAAERAARDVALAEDDLAFHGATGSTGFLARPDGPRLELGDWSDPRQVAADLVNAAAKLDEQGIQHPYAAVLDPGRFFAYVRAAAERRVSTDADRLEGLFHGIFRSAVVKGGAVFSLRGGDFLLSVGGDLSVGYRWHDQEAVHLFCVETVGAHLITPNAVCVLATHV